MRTILGFVALFGVAACGGPRDVSTALIPPDTPLAVADGQETMPYGDAVSGGVGLSMAAPPLAIEPLPAGCRPVRARSGAKAAYVYTYGGSFRAPLHHVSFRITPEQAAARSRVRKTFHWPREACWMGLLRVHWAGRIHRDLR